MAIPTMLHLSDSIPEADGASALLYLPEEALHYCTQELPLMETLTLTAEKEPRLPAAQREGEQCVNSCLTRVQNSIFQPQLFNRVTQSSTVTAGLVTREMHRLTSSQGTHPKKHRHQRGKRKKRVRLLRSSQKDTRSGKESNRATPPVFPLRENHHSRSLTCSTPKPKPKPKPQSVSKPCSRSKDSSWAQGATPGPSLPRPISASGLGLHGLNVACCSDIYSSNGCSGCPQPASDPESAYIYAESVKGCEGSWGLSPDCDSLCLKTPHNATSNPLRYEGYGLKGSDSDPDSDLETLCMYMEEESSCDSLCWSVEAVLGSVLLDGDSDSTCIHSEREKTHDSWKAEACSDSPLSLVEAHWGSTSCRFSSSSDSSCYTDDRDSESHIMEPPDSSCDSDTHPEFDRCDSPVCLYEEESFDLYNASPQSIDGVRCGGEEEEGGGSHTPCFKEPSERRQNKAWGVVTQVDRCNFSLMFHEMVKEATQDKDQEKIHTSEGFLFHPHKFLQAKNSEYREGREYSLLRHIQNGSYGDVFSIRDKQTGFTCAAKRIPLCSFSWEEVGTWSRLNSPRVLQLYGAVREGLNVVLFMDLKTGSLAQLLKGRGCLSEDLALYYHCQVLQALEHLHSRRVLHLDVKVDNVLLSKDGRESFLCDFGLSEMLDQTGYSTKTFRGNGLRGTESHMSPEVARGEPCCGKADVWSSCCMLLHMLSGHQPWTRYYTHPLCLKIVSEPAPLWEIPPGCDPLTCEVIRAGLVKDPEQRDSAKELLEKVTRAFRAVGGLSDLVLPTTQDLPLLTDTPKYQSSSQEIPDPVSMTTQKTPPAPSVSSEEELSAPRIKWVSTWRERAEEEEGMDSEARGSEEESDWESEGETDEVSRRRTGDWMERYWRTREGHETRRPKQQRLLKDERKPREEREPREDIYTEEPQLQKNQQETERETPDESDSEWRKSRDHTALEEGGSREGEPWSLVDETETEKESEDDDAEEEDQSDLESLRELGSDWADEEWEPFQQLQIIFGTEPQYKAYTQSEDEYSNTEEESVTSPWHYKNNMDVADLDSKLTLTCHRSTCASEPELLDKDSDWSDDLSSGVFSSYSSLTDGQSFNVDWSVSTTQPPSCCFEGLGVDIWIEDVSGTTLRIREKLKVKLGHVAVGISAQISIKTFSLATLDGKLVCPDTEVLESGMWLQCVPAPDGSTSWDWRVRDGKLETQDYDRLESDTCSTLAV